MAEGDKKPGKLAKLAARIGLGTATLAGGAATAGALEGCGQPLIVVQPMQVEPVVEVSPVRFYQPQENDIVFLNPNGRPCCRREDGVVLEFNFGVTFGNDRPFHDDRGRGRQDIHTVINNNQTIIRNTTVINNNTTNNNIPNNNATDGNNWKQQQADRKAAAAKAKADAAKAAADAKAAGKPAPKKGASR